MKIMVAKIIVQTKDLPFINNEIIWKYMLWFKFIIIIGLMFFELVSILFAIVPDYGNGYMTKENKNWISFKNLHQNLI